ncbi:MAG: TRAP transporter TatT component family protein [Candidatus Goldiibacteriota bacterium]
MMRRAVIFVFLIMFVINGCSMRRLAVDTTALFMDDVVTAFLMEEDMKFAENAGPGNLKLLDGLIRGSDFENEDLLIKGCKLYGMYTIAFFEDASADKKQDRENLKRASVMYDRAREYGMTVLKKNHDFRESLDKTYDEYKKNLMAFGEDDVEALFWTAFAWGSYINLNRNNIRAVANLPRARAMMERVIELDNSYFYGMPHLFMIVNYSMPAMFGGNPEKAMKEYEALKSVSGDKLAIGDIYMAKYYAVQARDKELFDELLDKVENVNDDIIPEKLLTAVAKAKAKVLRKKKSDLF